MSSIRQIFLSEEDLTRGLTGPHPDGFSGDVVAFVEMPLAAIAKPAGLSPQRTWEEGLGPCWYLECELPSGRRTFMTDHDGGIDGASVGLMGRASFDWDETFAECIEELAIPTRSITWRQTSAMLALHGAMMWGSAVADFAFVLDSGSARILSRAGDRRPILAIDGQYRSVVIRDDQLRAEVVGWLSAEGVPEVDEWPPSS